MKNWTHIVEDMGIDPSDLGEKTETKLKQMDFLCRRAGGRILSRQIVANVIVENNPVLVKQLIAEEGEL